MLSNFLVCINAVIPLFILLVIGYLVRRTGLLKDEEVHRFNHMVFLVFFPPLMFQNLYGNNDGFLPDGKLLLFAVPFILCVILLSIPLVRKIEKNPRSQGAMIQAVYRSNFILMGLPVAINIFGKGNVSQTALLIAVIVPMYNVVSVIILESFRGSKPDIGQILKKDGTIEFKTDNRDLFDLAVEEVEAGGFKILQITYDLHSDPVMNKGNIMTEYEEKFSSQGNPIFKYILGR